MTLRRRLEKEDYQDKPFCGYCNLVDVDLYETLRQYFEEIQDARNRGYGWGQIRAALRNISVFLLKMCMIALLLPVTAGGDKRLIFN